MTHIVPVYEGYALGHLTRRLDIAGRDITRQLMKLLSASGYNLNHLVDLEPVRQMKERYCYVSGNLQEDLRLARETTVLLETHEISPGRRIQIEKERFEAPEILFQPSLLGHEVDGLSDQVFSVIQNAEIDMRADLYKNIVLSGGSTMFPGLPTRLEGDLKDLYIDRIMKGDRERPMKIKIRVEDPPKRKHLVFQGGAVMADLMKDRSEFWISQEEWNELGTKALDKLGKQSQ